MVLDIGKDEGPRPKCSLHHGHLPGYIDGSHPPTKKEPFRTIAEQRLSHTLDVLLLSPSSSGNFAKSLSEGLGCLQYAKVHMKLGETLTGDFFNEYIKKGKILMLAKENSGSENTFTLADGILRLEVDKATFERSGLEGKPIPSEGRKHVKARYAIELNLRLPSMVRGKKGFERVLWACKNVFDYALTWLFYDLNPADYSQGPIAAYSPVLRSVEPSVKTMNAVLCPRFPAVFSQQCEEDAADLLEWLTLVMNGSPRVLERDLVDEYVCRYTVPTLGRTDDDDDTLPKAHDLVHFQWHGFIPSEFATKILLAGWKASGDRWVATSAAAFNSHRYATFKHNDQVTTWKYAD